MSSISPSPLLFVDAPWALIVAQWLSHETKRCRLRVLARRFIDFTNNPVMYRYDTLNLSTFKQPSDLVGLTRALPSYTRIAYSGNNLCPGHGTIYSLGDSLLLRCTQRPPLTHLSVTECLGRGTAIMSTLLNSLATVSESLVSLQVRLHTRNVALPNHPSTLGVDWIKLFRSCSKLQELIIELPKVLIQQIMVDDALAHLCQPMKVFSLLSDKVYADDGQTTLKQLQSMLSRYPRMLSNVDSLRLFDLLPEYVLPKWGDHRIIGCYSCGSSGRNDGFGAIVEELPLPINLLAHLTSLKVDTRSDEFEEDDVSRSFSFLIRALPHCSKLKRLELWRHLNDDFLATQFWTAVSSCSASLEELILHNMWSLGLEEFRKCIDSVTQLKQLTLPYGCGDMPLGCWPNLVNLNCVRHRMTESEVDKWAMAAPRLERFVFDAQNIDVFIHVGFTLPSLTEVCHIPVGFTLIGQSQRQQQLSTYFSQRLAVAPWFPRVTVLMLPWATTPDMRMMWFQSIASTVVIELSEASTPGQVCTVDTAAGDEDVAALQFALVKFPFLSRVPLRWLPEDMRLTSALKRIKCDKQCHHRDNATGYFLLTHAIILDRQELLRLCAERLPFDKCKRPRIN